MADTKKVSEVIAAPEDDAPQCVTGHHHAYEKKVLNRLARTTGHLKSISGMVERGSDCSEVLIQLAAVRSEINGICNAILKEHIDHCLVEAALTGNMQSVGKLETAIASLMKYS